MFGSIGQWMIEDLAGIEPLVPGYGAIEIRPEVPSAGLDRVAATLDTVRGRVASSWRRTADGLVLDLTVPAGATALAHVPASDPATVSEDGGGSSVRPAEDADGVERVGVLPGRILYRVGSGAYRFRVAAGQPSGTR